MEPTLLGTACLICFETTGKLIFVTSDSPEKIFHSCHTYLHSTISKETQNIIQQNKQNHLPICTRCFNSASELTRLSEQLTTIQKDLSDLSLAFSMAVFHRRSQVYTIRQIENNSQCVNSSSIIEFNEACLPCNLFSTKNDIHNKSNRSIIIENLSTDSDITNVKQENRDLQFDFISETNQTLIANDDAEIQTDTNVENLDKHCRQHTTERNRNTPEKQIRIVRLTGGIDLINCAESENGMQSATSNVSDKSVRMPEIRLEKIKVDSSNMDSSDLNSFNTNDEKRHKLPDEVIMDDEGSDPSYAPSSGRKKKFSRRSKRKTHEKTHTRNSSFNCSLGEENINNQNVLITHERIHTGKRRFPCPFCQKAFPRLRDLNIHKRTHTGEKPFKCSFCQKEFTALSIMKRHVKCHIVVEKPYECSFCKKRCNKKSHLEEHERIHTGEKPFKCSFCDQWFAQSITRSNHERIHTGEKPFECSFCHQRFARSNTLKGHIRTHTGKNRFICTICKKRFAAKNRLETHIMQHTGERSCQ